MRLKMSKFNKFLTILCLTAFIFTVGCNNKPTNPNGNGSDFEFLKVGNKWQYETRFYNKDNISTYISDTIEIIKIEKSIDYPNTDAITRNIDVGIWYANDKGFYANEIDLNNNYSIIYKNYYVGQKWSYTDYDGNKITSEVLSINESVTVPAETFSCVKIRETDSKNKSYCYDTYFSPKYGIIMTDYQMEEGVRLENVLIYKNY